MRDVARRFDAENELVRRFVEPVRVAGGALQRIKGTVDFDAGKRARRECQLALLRQARWIEFAAPGCVAPSGNANANIGHCPALGRWPEHLDRPMGHEFKRLRLR